MPNENESQAVLTVERFEKFAVAIHEDLRSIKTEIGGMKGEIGGMKEEITGMKGEISGMKGEISGMKGEIAGVKAEVAGIKTTMAMTMATKEDLENLKGDLGTRISEAKEQLQEQINGLHYAKEIDELRGRVTKVEEKVGIPPPRYKPA